MLLPLEPLALFIITLLIGLQLAQGTWPGAQSDALQQCYRACCGASCDGADARSPRVLSIENTKTKNTIEQATATARAIA